MTFETRGSAVATAIQPISSSTTYAVKPSIFLTNISGADIECRVKMYDHNGNDVSSIIKILTGNDSGTGSVDVAYGSDVFSMPAGSSRLVSLWTSNMNKRIIGHAVIEWGSEDPNVRKALLAEGRRITTNGTGPAYACSVQVNGGMPF